MFNKKLLSALLVGTALFSITSVHAANSVSEISFDQRMSVSSRNFASVIDPSVIIAVDQLNPAKKEINSAIIIDEVPIPVTIAPSLKSRIVDGAASLAIGTVGAAVKTAAGFTGVAYLTDTLVAHGLDAVEGAALYATGNKWIAKGMRVAAFDTVYNVSKDTAFIIGANAPGMIVKSTQAVVHAVSNPYEMLEVVANTAGLAVKVVSTQAASYALTQPINDLVANSVYYGSLYASGSPAVANAAYAGAKGMMHMTGIGNTTAKAIGYKLPSIAYSIANKTKSVISNILFPQAAEPVEATASLSAVPVQSEVVEQVKADGAPTKSTSVFGKVKSYFGF